MNKKNIIKFRYATEKDKDSFANILLEDNDAKIKLNLIGASEKLEWKSDKWNVWIVGLSNKIKDKEDELVGFFYIATFSDRFMNRLEDFYIKKEYRNHSYGLQFLEYAEKLAYKNWEAKGIDVFTIDNIPMEKLLIKRNFKYQGEYKNYYYRQGRYYSQKWWVKLYE